MSEDQPILRPSDVSDEITWFDRFAAFASAVASRATFFNACVLLVVLWLIEGFINVGRGHPWSYFLDDKYELQINTVTTVVTFLLVALIQNSQTRANNAIQHKLNAVAEGLACLLEDQSDDGVNEARELRLAVGLEQRESA